MATAPFSKSNHLLTTAKLLRWVGGQEYDSGVGDSPNFSPPECLGRYLKRLATVIGDDGSLNGKSRHAERVAICLQRNRKADDALRLFQAIVEGKDKILFLNRNPKPYCSEAVADKPGVLGYEGVYRFGLAAHTKGKKGLAKRLFLEIIENTPTQCFPIRLQDIRVESLEHLRKLGVKKLASGCTVAEEYKSAEAHQY